MREPTANSPLIEEGPFIAVAAPRTMRQMLSVTLLVEGINLHAMCPRERKSMLSHIARSKSKLRRAGGMPRASASVPASASRITGAG